MSKTGGKIIKINRNEFPDRRIEENVKFPALNVRLETIDTALLLLDSQETMVLLGTLRHMVDYITKSSENIALLKEKNVLQLLLEKQFYRDDNNILVKRLALLLGSLIIEKLNCLVELENPKMRELLGLALSYCLEEDDEFCCEYLSVIINKCLEDPQCVDVVLKNVPFILKNFSTISTTTNPDVLLDSFEILHKLLLAQSGEQKLNFIKFASFPLDRLLCELKSEFFEIREAALKALQTLVAVPSAHNILNGKNAAQFLLEQLTAMLSEKLLPEKLSSRVVEVLAAAMEHDFMISLFFELNLFDKYLEWIGDGSLEGDKVCEALGVFAECARCAKFLPRLVSADITELLLECLLSAADNPPPHCLIALNRLMKSPTASKRIIAYYDRGLLKKILEILSLRNGNIKTREQAANLLENLLSYAFHKTARGIMALKLPTILINIFAQNPTERSIDLLLSLLHVIETMADHSDYRVELCANEKLISHMGILLKNSFSTAILVTNLLRCFCCLVNEEAVHDQLLKCSLCSSIKQALLSPSNQVKTAVTNFIMQTTRFPKFVAFYKDSGLLDVLLLNQKHAFCVPTWKPAVESILSKNLTMKFCIRNSLGFTDITVGGDFMVSKRKFSDFRVFQCILKEDVSPLQPVIVVNFNRAQTPQHLVVKVPSSCGDAGGMGGAANEQEWCYCRSPGDEFLPAYLEEVNSLLKAQALPLSTVKKPTGIDFEHLAKRAKVIAKFVAQTLGNDLKTLDLNTDEECSNEVVKCHLKELCMELHCSFIPLGRIRTGCKFERAVLFKTLADQVGLPCTLQRSVDGRALFNELPLPVQVPQDVHCDTRTLSLMPWRLLRPTHIVDLMYNVGEFYPLQSRDALQYLRLY